MDVFKINDDDDDEYYKVIMAIWPLQIVDIMKSNSEKTDCWFVYRTGMIDILVLNQFSACSYLAMFIWNAGFFVKES